jgi:hypothetical protein
MNQYFWIVEKLLEEDEMYCLGRPVYYSNLFWDGENWQEDETKALRFSSKKEAQVLGNQIGGEWCSLEVLDNGDAHILMG